jgi:hypothetical protein
MRKILEATRLDLDRVLVTVAEVELERAVKDLTVTTECRQQPPMNENPS